MTAAARYRAVLYLLLAPYLVGVGVLVVVPVALSFGLAFTVYDGLSAPQWHGLGDFRALLTDPLFQIAARNSLVFVALTVPLRVVIALGLALLLDRPRRGVGLYRVAVYVPHHHGERRLRARLAVDLQPALRAAQSGAGGPRTPRAGLAG